MPQKPLTDEQVLDALPEKYRDFAGVWLRLQEVDSEEDVQEFADLYRDYAAALKESNNLRLELNSVYYKADSLQRENVSLKARVEELKKIAAEYDACQAGCYF